MALSLCGGPSAAGLPALISVADAASSSALEFATAVGSSAARRFRLECRACFVGGCADGMLAADGVGSSRGGSEAGRSDNGAVSGGGGLGGVVNGCWDLCSSRLTRGMEAAALAAPLHLATAAPSSAIGAPLFQQRLEIVSCRDSAFAPAHKLGSFLLSHVRDAGGGCPAADAAACACHAGCVESRVSAAADGCFKE
jgi:hypothetical protein